MGRARRVEGAVGGWPSCSEAPNVGPERSPFSCRSGQAGGLGEGEGRGGVRAGTVGSRGVGRIKPKTLLILSEPAGAQTSPASPPLPGLPAPLPSTENPPRAPDQNPSSKYHVHFHASSPLCTLFLLPPVPFLFFSTWRGPIISEVFPFIQSKSISWGLPWWHSG